MSLFIAAVGYILGIIIIVCVSMIYTAPLKTLLKILLNSAFGCVFLSISNLFLEKYGIHIGISPFTAMFTGILGLPGAIAVILIGILFR